MADAALALQAFLRWGDACFEHLLGPLAAAIVDTVEQRVVLARDALGSRSVYYHLDEHLLVAASEPFAVLAHPSVSDVLDERTLIRWYAVMAPRMGATFFADVSELPYAQAMAVDRTLVRQWQHWQVDPEQRLHYRRDDEYAEHFRDLLTESVRCRLRATTPVGVSLSGGYDSSSVAALAAKELATQPGAVRLKSFTWLFDELPECDERKYAQAVVDHCGLESVDHSGR